MITRKPCFRKPPNGDFSHSANGVPIGSHDEMKKMDVGPEFEDLQQEIASCGNMLFESTDSSWVL